MAHKAITETLDIQGMTCASCEGRIQRGLMKLRGVESASVSYERGRAQVRYDPGVVSGERIRQVIESLDYQVAARPEAAKERVKPLWILGVALVLFALYFLLDRLGALNLFNQFPQAKEGMGYGMLFVIGLLTSLHCVAMCGGINLSQCARVPAQAGRWGQLRSSALYNGGRVLSYTFIGGIVGAVGSAVTLSGPFRGAVQLAAGVFMVIMGLNLLGLFPWLRKLTPRLPRFLTGRLDAQRAGKGPFIVGLFNGLMPCGPLQAMQLYALSTGSALGGALSMLLFSLGTVPLMFGLGALSSVLTKKFTHRMLAVSAVLVVVLGVSMFQSGMSLSSLAAPKASLSAVLPEASPEAAFDGVQEADAKAASEEDTKASPEAIAKAPAIQEVTSKVGPRGYEPITVKAGVPVKWTLQADAKSLNGCNYAIVIPALELSLTLEPGDNVLEFTPQKSGVIPFSCWMGMIRSQIIVED